MFSDMEAMISVLMENIRALDLKIKVGPFLDVYIVYRSRDLTHL